MTDLASLYIKVDSSGVVTASKSLNALEGDARKVEKATDSVTASFRKQTEIIKQLAVAYGVLKLAQYVKDVAMLAARYETLGVVMHRVGLNAGYTGAQMETFAKGLEKAGISMVASRESLARMIQAHMDLNDASKLARVAQDAAVIGNINSSEAFMRLVYGIQSAQVEMLRTIGINVSFENSYKKVAAATNRTVESFTEAEKSQIRMNAAMDASQQIAGTYEEAMGTAGKQVLSLERHVENLKVLLGLAFTPALTEIIEQITGAIVDLNGELSGNSKDKISDWGNSFRLVLIEIETEITRLAMLIDKIGGTLTSAKMLLYGPGSALGIDSSVKRFENAAQENMDLESRYKKSEQALLELAKKYNEIESSMSASSKARAKAEQEASDEIIATRQKVLNIAKALAEEDEKISSEAKAEAEKASKHAEQIRKTTLNQMLEDALRNNELIEGAGKSQYEKDVARINAQAAVYYAKSKDMVAVNEWQAGAMAVADEKESQRKIDVAEKAAKDYKQLMEEESTFSVDQHTNAVNQILLEEQRKIEEIKRLQTEGSISPEQAGKATALVQSNTLEKLAEEDAAMLQEKADFYSELSEYADEYRGLVYDMIDAEAKRRGKAYKDDVAAAKWARNEKLKFEEQIAKDKLGNLAEGMGATASAFETMAQLYAEDSKEREHLHKISMAFHAAEQAALLAQAIAAAVTAVATQGGGDPYTAFARIAAMVALMASLISTIGGTFSGGGSSSGSTSKYTGTVLGGEYGDVSESVANSLALLEDTYDLEYRTLTGMYNEMKALNANITGLVNDLVRSGVAGKTLGFKNTSTLDAGGVGISGMTDTWTKINKALMPDNIWLQIGMGGLGYITNAITKFTGSLLKSAWGHEETQKIVGGGVRLTETAISDIIAGLNVVGYNYAIIKKTTTGGWLHGDKTSYRTIEEQLSDQSTKLFTDIFSNMSNVLIELSTAFGTDTQAVLDYTFGEIKLKLRKKSAEEINEIINAKISEMGDIAATELFGALISQYQQVGEGMLETATRLVVDKAVVAEILSMTGQSTNFVTGEFTKTRQVVTDEWLAWEKLSAKKQAKTTEPTKFYEELYTVTSTAMEQTLEFSEALITLAGTLEDLQDISATYYDKFFSDEEKQLRLQTQLQGAMEDINQVMPDTRAGYRSIVEGLDLTTDAGKLAYITMLQLSEAADQYYGVLEDALEDATDAQNEYIESLKELIITIDEWLANLNLSDISPVGSEAAWQKEYATTLAAATVPSASAEAVSDFLNYATKFLTYEKKYGTDSSYLAIYDAVVADVMAIRALTTATIGSYAEGTNYVPKTGAYTLHEGEMVIPVKESNSIRSGGSIDADAIGKAVAKYIGVGSGDVHVSIQIDGREIGNVVARQVKTNGDLQTSIRRIAA